MIRINKVTIFQEYILIFHHNYNSDLIIHLIKKDSIIHE